jgi:peptide/nickel transport system substrate-binding protein
MHTARTVALVAVGALALAACAQSQREQSGTGASGSASGAGGSGTFVFAASADPVSLDPALASDGETFRVSRQIFEGLVSTKTGTADPAPGLAESWTGSSDGLSYTFTLRPNVTFSDGTPFDATAVCANFERWYNWTGILQSENLSYYYRSLFRGYKTSDDPTLTKGVYDSCAPDGATKVTVKLKTPYAAFVSALSLPAFAMQSPTALKKYKADDVGGTENEPRFSEYATAHPTGTGPFVLGTWTRGQQVTLKPNPNYWGDKPKVSQVVIRTISDGKARLQALQNGDIDGYDLVAPGDIDGLKAKGLTVLNRPVFNILYLGMNQASKPLSDLRVRQAIAYAINKEAVVRQSLPPGTKPATQFIPDTVAGYADDVPTYGYDPAKAKALLAQAGATGATITFNYPTGVSRPYMPNPEDTFAAIRSQLQAVGLKVTPVADKWSPEYLDKIQGGTNHGIHLLGWTGDYNDTDNFVGVFFGKKSNEWGFDNTALFSALEKARQLPTVEQQIPAYKAINKQIMEFLPGVPLASPVPSLAFATKVKGYTPSPVQDEVWNTVSVS